MCTVTVHVGRLSIATVQGMEVSRDGKHTVCVSQKVSDAAVTGGNRSYKQGR